MSNKPKTICELMDFYYERFKPLYGYLQSLAKPPIEMHFEENAAFDHLSRFWRYKEPEEQVVSSACAHLKRGCFDAFKIATLEARLQYDKLRDVDVSIIDNGDFEREMIRLHAEITSGAVAARQVEGDSRNAESWHKAFDLWEPVYVNCIRFRKEFFENSKVEWAKRKQAWKPWRNRIEGILIGIGTSIVASIILFYTTPLFDRSKPSGNTSSTASVGAESIAKPQPVISANLRISLPTTQPAP